MKTLILMRHAKAVQFSGDLTDRHRPLASQGVIDAEASVKKLLKHKIKVDELKLSPSTRTIETAQIVKQAMGSHIKSWSVEERLYLADLETLLDIIARTSENKDVLMLIGHNPGLEELSEFFLNSSHHLKTADLILFKFDVDTWAAIQTTKPFKSRRDDAF